MADVQITSNFGASGDIQIRDGSPLAKAKLTQLGQAAKEFFAEFDKPMDQADVKRLSFGARATSPNLLSGGISSLEFGGGTDVGIDILDASDGSLFGKDQFALAIPIDATNAWLAVELDILAKAKAGVSTNSVGVSFEDDRALICKTYTRFQKANSLFPTLREACVQGFNNFSLTTSAEDIRSQLPNTVNQTECSGSISTKVTLKQPYSLNALASVNLPFNATASIQPNVTLQVSGSIEISGDFIFRSYKSAEDVVEIGIYKKHGSMLSAAFTAGADLGGDIDSSDILGPLLNATLPGVNITAAGITGENAKDLNQVIKNSIDRSLTAELNITCSAAYTDEAAVVYRVQLSDQTIQTTDTALKAALLGDWTLLGGLANASLIRDIVVETVEKKRYITLNLFGIYSATSYSDYVKTCTIMSDDSGQVSLIDKAHSSRISAASDPYMSDPDKLRKALTEDFVCTAAYAVVKGKLNLDLSVLQSYMDYARNMSRYEMNQNIRLGYQLGLIPKGSLDMQVNATPSFSHACVSATVRYETPAIMNMFFNDRNSLTGRTIDELEQAGREIMCDLLDNSDPIDAVRISILNNSGAWAAMDRIGNTNVFGTVEELRGLRPTELAAVTGDWVSIRWWADIISKVAPILGETLTALQSAPVGDPTHDQAFMKQQARLTDALGAVARNTNAAFVHGWGAAVIFALSGRHGIAEMDLSWTSIRHHYEA